jgi:hypothetical protein
MITPFFLRDWCIDINTVLNNLFRHSGLIIDGFDMKRLGLKQNVGIKSKILERVLRNLVETRGKIRSSKFSC